jgi:membrane-bound lytic murein transglycosylase D
MPGFQGLAYTGTAVAAVEKAVPTEPRYRKIRHTVRRGESVAAIAERYDVTIAQLARWNSLRRGKALVPKQQLVVLLPISDKPASSKKMVAANKLTVPDKLPLMGIKTPAVVAKAVPVKTPVTEIAEEDTASAATIVAVEPAVTAPNSKLGTAKSAPNKGIIEPETTMDGTTYVATAEVTQDSVPTEYVVRKGDFLEKLARTKGVSVAQLMAWNQLNSIALTPGQKLVFYAPASAEIVAQNAPQAADEEAPRVATAKAKPQTSSRPAAISKVHLVQPGDTLYNISRRYEGVTVDQLRKLNNLKSDAVKPGQQLIVAR